MHRAFSIILVVLLVVALAIPAFATEFPENLPAPPSVDGKPYTYFMVYGSEHNLFYSDARIYVKEDKLLWMDSGTWVQYKLQGNEWVYVYEAPATAEKTFSSSTKDFMWSSIDVYYSDGSLFYDAMLECDGTTCPANDVNHDNICDDCGKVLTYNLRSTLLDFAKAQAESWSDTWPYYAVVQLELTDRYYVYMANNPMVADKETGLIVTSPNGLNWFEAHENSDGSFVASGNYGATEWTGELIYSNHTIENFLAPPLAVIIQGVTGEALETTLPNLMNQVKTIVLSGVLCLALLICLPLLLRSLKIFGIG